MVFYWGNIVKIVPLYPITNIPTFWTKPGYSSFSKFCAKAGFDEEDKNNKTLEFQSAVISDDENDDDNEVEYDKIGWTEMEQ